MKKVFLSILIVILCINCSLSISAAPDLLVDDAGLLEDWEVETMSQMLDEISMEAGCDIVIITVDSLEGERASDYADDFYDYNGYSEDGVLFLLSMEERDWWISTSGLAIEAIDDERQDIIFNSIKANLSDGEYFSAFTQFAAMCSTFYMSPPESSSYNSDGVSENRYPYSDDSSEGHINWFSVFMISLIIGAIVALIIVSSMKGALKSVKMQAKADNYIKTGSMKITGRRDTFLYRNVTKTPRPQSTPSGGGGGGSRTHTSSSGRSHGGSGGKF